MEKWIDFFVQAGIKDPTTARKFAEKFIEEKISQEMIETLTERDLKDLGVDALGDRLRVLKHIKREINKTAADPTTLDSLFPQYFTLGQFSIRKTAYIKWANSNNVTDLFRRTLFDTNCYFKECYLKIEDEKLPQKDILTIMKECGEKFQDNMPVPTVLEASIIIQDHPLSIPILIDEEILQKNNRNAASSKINDVGCQHLYLRGNMLDSSTLESSDSSLDFDESPTRKKRRSIRLEVLDKLKTCQKAKYKNCQGELARHQRNSSKWSGNLCVDVLIFINGNKICSDLARFLGLIFLEGSILDGDINATIDEVLQIRTRNKNAYLWKFIQADVNCQLMSGCSNICLTSDYNIFRSANANLKSIILKECDREYFPDILKYCSFIINIKNSENPLIYISAISEIISAVLSVESFIQVVFYKSNEEKYYKLKLPLTSIVPFYILKFFSQILIKKCIKNELSYNLI